MDEQRGRVGGRGGGVDVVKFPHRIFLLFGWWVNVSATNNEYIGVSFFPL